MSAKIKASGRSYEGHHYEVFFETDGFLGIPRLVPLSSNGITIDYEANGQDLDATILSSSCTVRMLVTSISIRSTLVSLLNSQENKHTIRVMKNGVLEWIGVILADQIEENDEAFPQEYAVTASDCLARLKNIDYIQPDSDELVPIATHLNRILANVPTKRFFGATDEFYRIHSTMWPTELTPSDSELGLEKVRASYKAFRTVDKQGLITPDNCYNVLVQLLQAFQLRLTFSGGSFVIFEVPSLTRVSGSIVFHRYAEDGTKLTNETLTSWADWQTTIGDNAAYQTNANPGIIRKGGKITGLAPVQKVEYTYKHYSRRNLMPGYAWSGVDNPDARLFNFSIGEGGGRLRVSGNIQFTLSENVLNPSTQVAFVVLTMRMAVITGVDDNVGSGLSREATITSTGYSFGPTTWNSGGANNDHQFVFNSRPPSQEAVMSSSFDVITPVVPQSGTLLLNFEIEGIYINGTRYFLADIEWEVNDVFVESLVDGNISNQFNYQRVTVEGGNAAFNSQTLERETLIGDGTTPTTFGRLEALVSADNWQLTTGWQRYANGSSQTGVAVNHLRLLANDLVELQGDAIPKMNSTIIAPLYRACYSLLRTNGVYLPLRVSIMPLVDECSGEWVQVFKTAIVGGTTTTDNSVGLNYADDAQPPPPPPPTTTGGGGVGSNPGPTQPGINTVATVTSDAVLAGVTLSALPIVLGPSELPVQEGDELIITNPYTGETTTVTVASDYVDGVPNPWVTPSGDSWITPGGDSWIVNSSPGISVESFTPTEEIPAGSYVQISPASQIATNAALRIQYEVFTLFGLTETVTIGEHPIFWRPVDRVGYRIKGFSIALGANPSSNTLEFRLKHRANDSTISVLGVFSTSALDANEDLDVPVQAGVYIFETLTSGAGITGLQVALKLKYTTL